MRLTANATLSVSKGLRGSLILAGVLAAGTVTAASGLYETGPEQDLSFVRFVNGTDANIAVSNSKTKAKLDLGVQGASRISAFLPIKAGAKMTATIAVGKQKFDVEVVAKPSEFITVAAVPDAAGAWKAVELREKPISFSSTRVSLAAFNFNAQCSTAQIDSVGKSDGIKNVTPQAIKRRFVGPIKAQVQISCAGKPVGGPLDMGQLEAGERYSIFILPARTPGLFVKDEIEGTQ